MKCVDSFPNNIRIRFLVSQQGRLFRFKWTSVSCFELHSSLNCIIALSTKLCFNNQPHDLPVNIKWLIFKT